MSIKNKFISNTIWAYLDKAVSAAFLFILVLIFIKSISFEEYGFFVGANLILNLLKITGTLGLDSYLVQKKYVNEELISKVFLLVIFISCSLIFLIYLFNGILDLNQDYSFLLKLMTILSWKILTDNLVTIINSIFYRELNNYKVAKISFFSWVLSFSLSLIALMYLNPFDSLIFFTLSRSIIRATISMSYVRIKVIFIKNLDLLKDFLHFGVPLVISKNLLFLNKKAPQIFCGYFLGPYEVGLLSASLLIVDYVNRVFTSAGQSIWIPILSKINRENPIRLREIYFRFRKIQFSFTLPIFVFIFAIKNELITYILPEKFLNIEQLLPYCLLLGVIISTNIMFVPLLISKGMTKISLSFSLLKFILSIILFSIFSPLGLIYLIYTLLIIETIFIIIAAIFLSKITMKKINNQIKDLFPVVSQSFIAFIFVYSTKFVIKDYISLLLISLSYILVYIFTIYLIDKNLLLEFKQMLKLFLNTLKNNIVNKN